METKTFFMTSNYYPPYHVGGACVHAYDLANAIADMGHEVHIIYSLDWYYLKKGLAEPKNPYPNNENIILHPIRSPLHSITAITAYTFGYYYPLSNKMLKIIKDVKPDVVHHHNITGLGPFILEAKADKVFYTAHDYWLICQTFNLLRNNRAPCLKNDKKGNCNICSILCSKPPQVWRNFINKNKLLKNIDSIISPSNFMTDKLTRSGIPRIETIPNFVSVNKSNDNRYIPEPYFLYVGRLEYSKGIINLIKSYHKIMNDTENHLIIAGDGSISVEVRALINSINKKNKIHFLGRVDNKAKLDNLYQYAEAVVIPSIWPENCPLVALEAISHEVPIIATSSGGLLEIIETTKAGVLIDNEDLVNNNINLLDIDLENARNNSRKFKNYYSKEKYMEKYLALINA